ncbi:MAG: hypothetical protein LIO77_00115 [Rikenellaceae bacterium]|nr:hypothetical protein [Rikenellaceae bacterium]
MAFTTGRNICRLGNIIILALLFLTAASCTKDQAGGGGMDTDEAVVRLTIRTPGVTAPRGGMTRTGVDQYGIGNIKVVVLEQKSGGSYLYKYMVDGQNVQPGENNKTTFYALLKASAVPIKLLIFANYGEAFEAYSPAAGETEESIRSAVVAAFDPEANFIPMYSEISLPGLDTGRSSTLSATMLRAWARVDVSARLDPALSKDFRISELYVYRGRNSVQAAPDASALSPSATPRVDAPSVPAGADTLEKYGIHTFDPVNAQGLCLAECDPVFDEAQKLKGTACIVVGGYYDLDTEPSYYRIDFDSGQPGHPYGQVLRNYRYSFLVTKVTGRGWDDPDDAANNRSTTIVTEIQMWEDFTTEMIANGDNYLGISSRALYLPYKKDAEKELHVQASVPYTVNFENSPSEVIGLGDTGSLRDDHFEVRIVNYPGDEDDVSHIIITTLDDNLTPDNFESRLVVRYASWTFDIAVTQYHFKEFVSRSIRVLSVHAGSSGNLGGMTTVGDGASMRRVLSNANNFSVSGTVDFFSGFDFTVSPGMDYFRYADGSNSYTHQVRSWLFACDVLYLANDNYISEYSARIIMEWLEASPSRVLIMGGDGDQTSPTLIRQDMNGPFSGDVDWWYNRIAASSYKLDYINDSGGFYSVPINSANSEFFTGGPFPTGGNAINFKVADNYFGYAKSYTDDIIPLITHSNLAGSMVVGVDKGRRVVYHGDASLWQTAQMSSTAEYSGTVSTDVDRFWANLWAWVAYQVIWADQQAAY